MTGGLLAGVAPLLIIQVVLTARLGQTGPEGKKREDVVRRAER